MTPITLARSILENLHITRPPVDVGRICRSYDVLLRYESGLVMDSCYTAALKKHRALIIVNDDPPLPRQRFNTAHELGHILLGHESQIHFESSGLVWQNRSPVQEEQADAFAMELLIPGLLLTSAHLLQPEDIAELCCVSLKKVYAWLHKGLCEQQYRKRSGYMAHRGNKEHKIHMRDRKPVILGHDYSYHYNSI